MKLALGEVRLQHRLFKNETAQNSGGTQLPFNLCRRGRTVCGAFLTPAGSSVLGGVLGQGWRAWGQQPAELESAGLCLLIAPHTWRGICFCY